MPSPTLLRSQLAADPTLDQDADYLFDWRDRAYIDDQVLTAESHTLSSLLLGLKASFVTLDPSSPAASPGDAVCSAGGSRNTVTRALATPLAAAGVALGVVLLGAAPGGKVLVAFRGLVPARLLGSVAGSGGFAQVNTSNARPVASSGLGTYSLGTFDAAGNLTLRPRTYPSSFASRTSGLIFSPVDVATGYGETGGFIYVQPSNFGQYYGQTSGVGFGVTQAGRYCTGARFWWGDLHTIRISLWTPGSGTTPVAFTSVAGNGSVSTASFNAPVALTPGQPYAITMFDATTPSSDSAHAPGYYHYIGSNGYSQPNMGNFVPHPRAPNSALWGPYSMGVNFFADSGSDLNDIYGVYATALSASDTCPNASSIFWYPIEPMLK